MTVPPHRFISYKKLVHDLDLDNLSMDNLFKVQIWTNEINRTQYPLVSHCFSSMVMPALAGPVKGCNLIRHLGAGGKETYPGGRTAQEDVLITALPRLSWDSELQKRTQ